MTSAKVDEHVARAGEWSPVISDLRKVLVNTTLTEELKWGKPCYSHQGANVVIVQPMKHFVALMFFKGALLDDPAGVLEEQGPNSRSARRIRFTSTDDVARLASTVRSYVEEAIEVEDAGLEVGPAPELVLVEELQARLDADPALKAAFESLTPGRQREYHLHVSGAKQATTRQARVDRCVPLILAGKGWRDR